jgi:hypothetical protein
MASDTDDRSSSALNPEERRWLDRVRAATSLSQLREITGADSDHEAYVQTKPTWEQLRGRKLGDPAPADGLPGDRVVVEGQPFSVHGITHADTDAERAFLREHVRKFLRADESVHCEQGVRPMYFEDFERVTEIDDYRWAMHHCRQLDLSSHVDGLIEETFDEEESGVTDNISSAASRFRDVAYSLIDSGADVYGNTFASALGDAASTFLMDHEHLATGEDFTSHELSKAAAEDPSKLPALQQYYKRAFLPQPLEREWLRRHDHELELFTHARNERIAAWALYHADGSRPVHLIVGAAHQPGVVYYLEAYRENRWDYGEFEFVP